MTNQSYVPQQYLVCYIDLLGIREKLFNGINYHDSTVSREKQEEINKVSTVINELLEGLKSIDAMIHEKTDFLYELDKKLVNINSYISKEEFSSLIDKVHFSVQQFSDSTLLYIPFNQETQFAATFNLCGWNTLLAAWCLKCMSEGIMFRGAMTIGTAWELRPQCLFGPAVHEVYRMETENARHPRIVISKNLKEYIDRCLDDCRKNGVKIDYVPTPLHMVHTDIDGVYMFHYLSKVIKGFAEFNECIREYKQTISKSFGNLLCQYESNYKDANINPKCAELARRYLSVIRYFMSYNDDWDGCMTEQMKTFGQATQ